jgi:hypothetical protein
LDAFSCQQKFGRSLKHCSEINLMTVSTRPGNN